MMGLILSVIILATLVAAMLFALNHALSKYNDD